MRFVKFTLIALFVLVILGLSALAYMGVQSRGGAPLGLIDGQLAACPDKPNCVSSETGTSDDQKISPLPLSSWEKLPSVIETMGGEITARQAAYVSAEFSSNIFGFVDDVEFRLTDTGVQVRSGSRVGYSDAGVNGERIAELARKLAQ